MRDLTPSRKLFKLAATMSGKLWKHKLQFQKSRGFTLKAEILKIDRKVEQLLDRIVDTDSSTVIRAYEQRIQKLEKEKNYIHLYLLVPVF